VNEECRPATADAIAGLRAKWLVWSVWAALLIAAAGYVIHFGSNVPYWDDWNMVDVLLPVESYGCSLRQNTLAEQTTAP
jgi:hypothetical protein